MRIGSFTRLATAIAGLITATVAFGMPGQASADTACTQDAANAMVQAVVVPYQIMRPRGQHHPGLLDGVANCQYRAYLDGETFTFHESDYFVGGVVVFWDYKAQGMSRGAAIADLELETDRIWLAPKNPDGTTGAFVEQVLTRTAYKDIPTPTLGKIVYQHRAFIAHLPAGQYVSYLVDTYPGYPDFTATVNLVILPN